MTPPLASTVLLPRPHPLSTPGCGKSMAAGPAGRRECCAILCHVRRQWLLVPYTRFSLDLMQEM
ncbi:hypothetical protein E2C01_034390 [Portunus trituberculatus]|uniref:Uncharacterized protein n=1 Tax=Portunus trituberculatus TaxID=210409 RepID=A0A5B7F1H4_PORTR|nr:hypothetical protein [Portunus trituberculatus]